MRIEYRKRESLPKLAWCARLRAGANSVRVDHGPWVEARADHFFEGAWDGPMAQGRLDEATVLIGSGARLVDGGIVFAAPTNEAALLYSICVNSELFVSNSLVFVLTRVGDGLDPTYPYYYSDLTLRFGAATAAPKSLQTRLGRRVQLVEEENLFVAPELSVARREKPQPAPPGDYATYVSQLRRAVRAVFGNAGSPARLRPYRPVVQVSSGYDSPAVAVLVKDAGGREALTFSRSEGEPTHDDGLAVAELLGLSCTGYDKFAYKSQPGVPEAEFCTLGGASHHAPAAAMEEQLRGSVLCTGHGWRSIPREGSETSAAASRKPILVDSHAGSSRTSNEFRLRVGFLLFPVPYIGLNHRAAINAIARSHEMKPWSVGGGYDRPIQRRLVEEAGVPRRLFGQSKKATGHARMKEIDSLSAESRADYHAFYVGLRRRTPKLRWLKARARHALVNLHYMAIRFLARLRLPSFGLGLLPTRSYERIDIRGRWELRFTMQWAHERIRHRYLEDEPERADSHFWRGIRPEAR